VLAGDTTGSDLSYISVLKDGSYMVVGPAGVEVHGSHGTFVIQSNGSYVYTPDDSLTSIGKTDTFSYQLTSPTGQSDTATVTIEIEGLTPPPMAAAPAWEVNDHGASDTLFTLDDLVAGDLGGSADHGALHPTGSAFAHTGPLVNTDELLHTTQVI